MKALPVIFFLVSGICFSQPKYSKTKVSQSTRTDCSISSSVIVTKIFAKHSNNEIWDKIYETEVAIDKTRNAKKVREEEYKKAEQKADGLMAKLNEVPPTTAKDTLPPAPLVR